MLRLSSLLPIIEVTPLPNNSQDRKEGRNAAGDRLSSGTSRNKSAGTDSERESLAEQSPDSALATQLGSRRPGARSPLLSTDPHPQDESATGDHAKTSSGQAESRLSGASAKASHYGLVNLLNPALGKSYGVPPSHEMRLSETASLLSTLMTGQPQKRQAGSIVTPHPLLTESPADTRQLASALKNAVSQSGLFYESHLEQWMNGARTIDLIRQEPQGRMPPDLAFTPASNLPAEMSNPGQPQQSLQWLQQNLVQQLAILNNPVVVWTGQVWPNQHATIQTRREAPQIDPQETRWTTRLNLDMPRLGKIDVVISLDRSDVELAIRTESSQTREQLRSNQNLLGSHMADTGCRLRHVSLKGGDEQD